MSFWFQFFLAHRAEDLRRRISHGWPEPPTAGQIDGPHIAMCGRGTAVSEGDFWAEAGEAIREGLEWHRPELAGLVDFRLHFLESF
eukprot:CAMPEP_0118817250 /NCGR_PEP_ID=MMETSP1162-20130426/5303_1 /TAXON_ID=33656 /ORGANISM="Phaeocystis Sp, Strain CCMP2710" /LENGTH=85 /DNA_ID=CAMNT_0006747337 /DNA_START=61 /DNA_END=318 /DNA_ORIENTATION=-